MKLDRARKHATFDVTADRHEVVGTERMAHAFRLLPDDWAFIEIACHVVGSRPDQLDPALVRLVVGLRTFERGQERVMEC